MDCHKQVYQRLSKLVEKQSQALEDTLKRCEMGLASNTAFKEWTKDYIRMLCATISGPEEEPA